MQLPVSWTTNNRRIYSGLSVQIWCAQVWLNQKVQLLASLDIWPTHTDKPEHVYETHAYIIIVFILFHQVVWTIIMSNMNMNTGNYSN